MGRSPLTVGLVGHLRRAALASAEGGLSDGQLLGEFLRTRDGDAFAALVRRHGPMVLGVCRRLVGDAHAAEDAFQAVFLVLARRAAAVRPREQVGGWLHGVAYRTALKARAGLARRRAREKPVDAAPHPTAPPPDAWADVGPVLDAELARLPDRLRLPVVLCDLEGRPQREVARQLGLPPATLANRLAAARRTLAARLTARGVTLSGGALAAVVSANGAAAVPPSLVSAAARVALGTAPAHIAQLSEGVIRMMLLTKLKAAAVAVVVLVSAAGGVGIGTLPAARADDKPTEPKPAARPALGPKLGDREFLTQTCLTLRGDLPTVVEMGYFLADPDPGKRKKVVNWLADGEPTATAGRTRCKHAPAAGRTCQSCHDTGRLTTLLLSDGKAVAAGERLYDLSDRSALTGRLNGNDVGSEFVADGGADGVIRLWDLKSYWLKGAGHSAADSATLIAWLRAGAENPDDVFLRRLSLDLRGILPTRVEREYYRADTDPKKREKLLNLFARDPEAAKKLTPEWQKTLLEEAAAANHGVFVIPNPTCFDYVPDEVDPRFWLIAPTQAPMPARLNALLGQLLEAKKPDDQVLDALMAAARGRLPTETERRLILAQVGKAPDKPAAWREVLATLADHPPKK